ncbi:hypothetical protein K431DRAFT_284166 [Polychaeton citri CBS 116435]|uniref:Uncharacterized protein n=1 Tax=Polychaeton citri CBS 116435 TaxID=1314669 RepID=A0A9P4URM9_9PEZI|nr:hypothetical protein K431DRAFT_284166 [Polychaeton citri CBS 116435]
MPFVTISRGDNGQQSYLYNSPLPADNINAVNAGLQRSALSSRWTRPSVSNRVDVDDHADPRPTYPPAQSRHPLALHGEVSTSDLSDNNGPPPSIRNALRIIIPRPGAAGRSRFLIQAQSRGEFELRSEDVSPRSRPLFSSNNARDLHRQESTSPSPRAPVHSVPSVIAEVDHQDASLSSEYGLSRRQRLQLRLHDIIDAQNDFFALHTFSSYPSEALAELEVMQSNLSSGLTEYLRQYEHPLTHTVTATRARLGATPDPTDALAGEVRIILHKLVLIYERSREIAVEHALRHEQDAAAQPSTGANLHDVTRDTHELLLELLSAAHDLRRIPPRSNSRSDCASQLLLPLENASRALSVFSTSQRRELEGLSAPQTPIGRATAFQHHYPTADDPSPLQLMQAAAASIRLRVATTLPQLQAQESPSYSDQAEPLARIYVVLAERGSEREQGLIEEAGRSVFGDFEWWSTVERVEDEEEGF